jgi:site-specific recombinase XerC
LRSAQLPVQALNPQRLDAAAVAAVRQILDAGESENTRTAYRTALRYWLAWFELRYGAELGLPVHPATVVQFVVDHVPPQPGKELQLPPPHARALAAAGFAGAGEPIALSTLALRLAALARLHRDRKEISPTDDESVRTLLAKLRKAHAKAGVAERKKAALDADRMSLLLATCDTTPQGVRDRALLAFGFATGGRRRSEIAAATFAQLVTESDGYRFRLGHSKTNQAAKARPEDVKPVIGEAARALDAWLGLLEDHGIARQGAIFRRVIKGGRIAGPLTPAAVRVIVRRRCELAGLAVEEFSAHSLRAGFLTEAGKRGVPIKDAMAMSGHSSVATAVGYMRAEELAQSKAASLLDH